MFRILLLAISTDRNGGQGIIVPGFPWTVIGVLEALEAHLTCALETASLLLNSHLNGQRPRFSALFVAMVNLSDYTVRALVIWAGSFMTSAQSRVVQIRDR